ncbi:MAG: rhodanese-like domain-containing protein [Candidatus Tumulicola sp.]
MNERSEAGLLPGDLDPTTSILDVRHSGHRQIRGALQYDPKALLDADPLALPLPHDKTVAVYGDNDETVARVVQKLRAAGYSGAAPLAGGIAAWESAGLPLEEITEEQPVPGEPGSGMQRL